MHIRQMNLDDISKWLELSKENDEYIAELIDDIRIFYNGFDEYMKRKIEQFEVFIAVDRMSDKCLGVICFSRNYNRITFFGVSKKCVLENVGDRLLNIAFMQLDSTEDITVQVLKSNNKRLLKEKEFFLNRGFQVYADDLIEEGVKAWGLRKKLPGKVKVEVFINVATARKYESIYFSILRRKKSEIKSFSR